MNGSSILPPATLSHARKFFTKGRYKIKEISKKELDVLLKNGILRNSHNGFINERGYHVGYYKTSGCAHKRYIEDAYVNKARELL